MKFHAFIQKSKAKQLSLHSDLETANTAVSGGQNLPNLRTIFNSSLHLPDDLYLLPLLGRLSVIFF